LAIFSLQEFFPSSQPTQSLYAISSNGLATATKEVKTHPATNFTKKALRELAAVGEEEHEGPLIDLVVLLSKIVRTHEHKGIHYTLEKNAPELIKPNKSEVSSLFLEVLLGLE
jgi:hypothetical protein